MGNWTWLRRQICGKAWVEGDYKNVVIDKETQTIVVGGIVTIHSDNGKVRFSGESFDEKGERGNFHSLECELYSAPDLIMRYTYELIHPESKSRIDIGCGLSVFIPDDPYPMRYYGDFHDSFNKGRLMIIADRITDPAELKALETTEGRYKLVRSHLESLRFQRWRKGPAIDKMPAEYPPPIASGRASPEAQAIAAQAGLLAPPKDGVVSTELQALPEPTNDGTASPKNPVQ